MTKIINIIIVFAIAASKAAGAEIIRIENNDINVREAFRTESEIYINLINDLMISKNADNQFKIAHKTDDLLKILYDNFKKAAGAGPNMTFEKFKGLRYAFDIVIDRESGAIKEFISNDGSIVGGFRIPSGVRVEIKHNRIAWIVEREIKSESFTLEKVSGDKKIFLSGRNAKGRGRTFTGRVYIDANKVKGSVADIPVKQYNCSWENMTGSEQGIVFDDELNIASARLVSGSIYGFEEKLNYIFSYFTSLDGTGVLKKIEDDNGEPVYGETGTPNKQVINRRIKWNNILLNDNDVLIIKKDRDVQPEDRGAVSYVLILKDSKTTPLFDGKKEYNVMGFPHEIIFYGNFYPESFVAGGNTALKTGDYKFNARAGSGVSFYKDGKLRSVSFKGIIELPVAGKNIKFRESISFHENSLFREGLLAEDTNLRVRGKDVILQENSILGFSSRGEFETVTTRDEGGKIKIIYIPVLED